MNDTSRPTRTAPAPTHEGVVENVRNALPAQVEVHAPAETVSERVEAPESDLPTSGPGAVIAGIAAIMAEIKPIEKGGWNKFHQYAHVRMQDLSRELTPLMGKHGIVVLQNEVGRELFDNGNVVAVRYHFTVAHSSGAIWPQRVLQTGLSVCRNTKSGFDDKSLAKAHTAARKYFLISLFQLASEDAEDGDNDSATQQQGTSQRPRRRAPSPTGKVSAHMLPVVNGEMPMDWAKRFVALVAKADTKAEIDEWYSQNERIIDKIKTHADGPDAYYAVVDGMDSREAALVALENSHEVPKPSEAPKVGGFPGDKPASHSGDPGDIPPALRRRRAPAPEAKPELTDDERDWISGLDGAFGGDEDLDSLDENFVRLLEQHAPKFSKLAVERANTIYNTNRDRIESKD